MKVAIFGDCHGCWDDLNVTIAKALRRDPNITHFVQVGDLAYHWPGSKPFKISQGYYETENDYYCAINIPFYWLDGNHENYTQLLKDNGASQPNMIYCPRGSIVEFPSEEGRTFRAMFFGGASSIDKAYRTPGYTWWPDESITQQQVEFALAQEGPLDIIFSHDFPISFHYPNCKGDFGVSDREGLDLIREKFKPKAWCFGHHHSFARGENKGTNWVCCPIIDERNYVIWDGDELMYHHGNIY